MGKVFTFLGMTVGLATSSSTYAARRQAFLSDVTYTTATAMCWSYLFSNLAMSPEEQVRPQIPCPHPGTSCLVLCIGMQNVLFVMKSYGRSVHMFAVLHVDWRGSGPHVPKQLLLRNSNLACKALWVSLNL